MNKEGLFLFFLTANRFVFLLETETAFMASKTENRYHHTRSSFLLKTEPAYISYKPIEKPPPNTQKSKTAW